MKISTMAARRVLLCGALAAASTLFLSGCFGLPRAASPEPTAGSSGGASDDRSADAAAAAITEAAGVEAAVVDQVSTGTQSYLSVAVELSPDFAGDLSAVADYALAEGWSQTQIEPGTVVSIRFTKAGAKFDATEAVDALGLESLSYPASSRAIDPELLADRLGPWPGPVPELPQSLR